ncbi:MAG: 2-deoxy-D-gluconate 3-dehydrogenase [candidate division NC10 bacterium]|nr:2-deoxy-D-gluconate 3-dehydrogenase [candidate division NC10 bacterium]
MVANPFDLSGKVAVVTGGGTGLGKGMAAGLARAGALVVLASRRKDVVERAAADMRATGGNAEGALLDVTQIHALPAFFDDVLKRHGGLDILVNNAGTNRRNPALEYTEQDWDTVMNLNLKSVFFCCQAAARIMKERGGGKIINTASLSSAIASTNQSAYSPSKAGVRMLTMQLAFEFAPYRINVNAIGPGWFRTPLNDDLFRNEAWARGATALVPWGRTGTPEDLAGAAVFLASRASDYVTGQVIYVDGGMLAGYKVRPLAADEA